MPFLKLYCKYCGKKWEEYIYSAEAVEKVRCPQCNDSNLQERKGDIYGYNYEPKKRSTEKKNAFGYQD